MSERPPSDDMERKLDALRPAPPTDDLMARLRAARPATRLMSAPRPPAAAVPSRHRRGRWLPLAAVLLALGAVAGLQRAGHLGAPASPAAASASGAEPLASAPPARGTVTPVAARPAPPVFLPVETTRHLVSLQAVPTIRRPDEAPRRLLRAVIVEDTTAVGAETDAALHFRKAREIYLPISNPVY